MRIVNHEKFIYKGALVLILVLCGLMLYRDYITFKGMQIGVDYSDRLSLYVEAIRDPKNQVTLADYLEQEEVQEAVSYYVFAQLTSQKTITERLGRAFTLSKHYGDYIFAGLLGRDYVVPEEKQLFVFFKTSTQSEAITEILAYGYLALADGSFESLALNSLATDVPLKALEHANQWQIMIKEPLLFDDKAYNPVFNHIGIVHQSHYAIDLDQGSLNFRISHRNQSRLPYLDTVNITLFGGSEYWLTLVDGNKIESLNLGAVIVWDASGQVTQQRLTTRSLSASDQEKDYLIVTLKTERPFQSQWESRVVDLPGNFLEIPQGQVITSQAGAEVWFFQVVPQATLPSQNPFDHIEIARYSIIVNKLP